MADGLIRAYGWSTDDPQHVAAFAGAHCAAIQHEMNVLADAPAMLAACDELELASIDRSPLAMGLLTGKYGPATQLPPDDVRAAQPWVAYFTDGRPAPEWLARLDAVREVLTSGGRSLAQGALCWLLARSPRDFRYLAPVPPPRPRRMPQRCAWDRCHHRRWPRSPGFSAQICLSPVSPPA